MQLHCTISVPIKTFSGVNLCREETVGRNCNYIVQFPFLLYTFSGVNNVNLCHEEVVNKELQLNHTISIPIHSVLISQHPHKVPIYTIT